MVQPQSSMTAEQILAGFKPQRIGRRILTFPEVGSTNRVVLEHSDESELDGLVVLADYQSAGRGRLGRSWHAPRRASILMSVAIVVPAVELASGPGSVAPQQNPVDGWLTLAAAVAACEAIRDAATVSAAIKWPNDLRVNGRKLGGILIESQGRPDCGRIYVVGIGINCLQHQGHFPPELREQATSLELLIDHPVDRVELARQLLRHLDYWLGEPTRWLDSAAFRAWIALAEPVGGPVRARCGDREVAGWTVAVDPTGGLILRRHDGGLEWLDPMRTTLL